jgi:nitrite reductase/ring-hydroxylating ferredoxin subunit
MMCEPCPYCEGRGYVKSKISVCHEIFRELRREMLDLRGTKVMVSVHPQVADLLYDEERRGARGAGEKFQKEDHGTRQAWLPSGAVRGRGKLTWGDKEMVFAAKLAEVPEWGKKLVQVEGQSILLVKSKGRVYACERECPHQGAPLEGTRLLEAGSLSCPRHGYRFDLLTGACRDHPEFTLRVYPVELRGDDIYLELK